MTIDDLRERVEGLDGPDREVDAAVCALASYAPPRCGTFVRFPGRNPVVKANGALVTVTDEEGRGGYSGPAPAFTVSLDAVLALVGEKLPDNVIASVTVVRANGGVQCIGIITFVEGARTLKANAKTPALALLAATLSAISKELPLSTETQSDKE
jgi:hypothetical protein